MNREDLEVYDRNIRLWGKDTQIKISNSNVLLINLSPSNTEVAKNLILSGINLLFLTDENFVTQKDVEHNFFFSSPDIGQKKNDVLKAKLEKINSLVSISLVPIDEINHEKTKIACIDRRGISEGQFEEIENFLFKNKIITYYIDNIYDKGFFINNLESNFIKKCEEQNKNNHIILYDTDEEGENKVNKNEVIELDKENENKKESVDVDYSFIKIAEKLAKNFDKKLLTKKTSKMLSAISYTFYKLNTLLEFQKNNIVVTKIKGEIDSNIQYYYQNRDKIFYPTECVIGGIISQEIVKCITMKEIINCDLYSYNPINEIGEFFSMG